MTIAGDFRTPGQLIKALLEARGWSQRVLAIVLGVDETGIAKIISGKRAVNAELALLLGEVFDVPAERFLELQQSYELARARIVTQPDPNRAKRAALFGDLPVTEMIKRGWLDAFDVRDTKKIESELIEFFGVKSLEEIEVLLHSAKKTKIAVDATPPQIAWIYRVKQLASQLMVGEYTPFSARSAVKKLSELLVSPNDIRKVPRILTESGIRFVIVESLASAKIDGVCFWLDNASPVIGMSLRFDRIDNFWFVLRHEIEHVIRQHGRKSAMVDAELEGERAGTGPTVSEEERIANEAAAEFCVPKQELKKFVARKAPFFAERDMLGFARTLQIHPGLVAGQLQHNTSRYDLFRNHLVKVRTVIAESAVMDGWGAVAPVET